MKKVSAQEHYGLLIHEGNGPVNDPPFLRDYMDKWDGEAFLKALAPSREHSVLEIGVGTDRLALRVLKSGCARFTGIDISPATIGRARENLSGWDNLSLILGDFLSHHFPADFDRVYCSLTLFHFNDKKAFVTKASRMPAPGGRLVLSIPKKKGKFNQLRYPGGGAFPRRSAAFENADA